MKKVFLNCMLLLCALVVGSSVWADTYSYTYTSTQGSGNKALGGVTWTIALDGGSVSTFSDDQGEHFGTNNSTCNSVTFTTSSISGVITSISIDASRGSNLVGSLSVKVDDVSYTLSSGNSSLTTSNATNTFTGSSSGEIEIKWTKSSGKGAFYIKGITVTYSAASAPYFTANDVDLDANASSGQISYTLNNPIDGGIVTAAVASDSEGFISSIPVVTSAENKVTFNTLPNTGNSRTATIALTYTYNTNQTVSKNVTILQSKCAYTTLPFNWEGGASSELLAQAGVTASGLGTDYAVSNAPYQIKMDGVADYILVQTNNQPGVVYINVKMLGGAGTSKISIQESSDGNTFTEVEEFYISGSQNDVHNLETSNLFNSTSRFIRIYKSQHQTGGNIGIGEIIITTVKPISISSVGWATFSSENALDFTNVSGLTAYLVEGVTGTTLDLSDAQGKVPASTGLLLNGEAGTYNIPVIASASAVGTNKLVACTSETVLTTNAGHYVLVNDGGAVFQNLSENGATIPAGKAYLNLAGAGAPDRLRIVAEENNATGVENVETGEKVVKFIENGKLYIHREGVTYDAMGRIVK